MSPGVATCRGICVRVAIGTGMAESVSLGLRGSSVSLVKGGVPKATDDGSLLGILHWETGAEAVEEACCSHSKAPGDAKLMAMAMSLRHSMVSA